MQEHPRGLLLAAMLACAPGCTVIKPVVGAVTGPIVLVGESGGGDWSGGCGDGRGVVLAFGMMSAIGAVGGLVTGVISDVQVLSGSAQHTPTGNWWNPFLTNTSERR